MIPELNKIYQGNTLDVLKSWPDGFIDCCVTSPPYWNLRNYQVDGQLGLEPTFQEYIDKLIAIFNEVKRVLKPTGTCWVNLGDSYIGGGGGNYGDGISTARGKDKHPTNIANRPAFIAANKIQAKSLCCIPDRFKIAMVDSGWICRNHIIWVKRNAMPQSCKDRFSVNWESIFFFTKQGKYWFEQQFENYQTGSIERLNRGNSKDNKYAKGNHLPEGVHANTMSQPRLNVNRMPPIGGVKQAGGDNPTYSGNRPEWTKTGRNMRAVWQINTQPFKGSHFAVFPEALVSRAIKAGCPREVCPKCGKAREKIYQETGNLIGMGGYGSKTAVHQGVSPTSSLLTKKVKEKITTGYTDCGCGEKFEPGIVLDLFMGSGTTAVVAKKLGRRWLGIDLNEKYIEMANRRIENTVVNREMF